MNIVKDSISRQIFNFLKENGESGIKEIVVGLGRRDNLSNYQIIRSQLTRMHRANIIKKRENIATVRGFKDNRISYYI